MEKYQKGMIVKGTVTGLTRYGVFVTFKDHYSGLIHISELSHSFVNNVNDFVNLGDTIFVKVLDVDVSTRRLRLNIKDICSNPSRFVSSKIKETVHGFSTLSSLLPFWIEKSLKKLEKGRISIDKQGIK